MTVPAVGCEWMILAGDAKHHCCGGMVGGGGDSNGNYNTD